MTHTIGGVQILPNDHIWNRSIANAPIHASSAAYITAIGATLPLKAKVSTLPNNLGIPYNLVTNATTSYTPTFTLAGQSDPGPYYIPASPLIENSSDLHLLCLNTDNGKLYEIETAVFSSGNWTGNSGAIFDLSSDTLRTNGWTSADAAGLPILPGLILYDEVTLGAIPHALRVAIPSGSGTYIWPARHSSGSTSGIPPHGTRFRLKNNLDISIFSAANQIILNALKTYGCFLADIGTTNEFRLYGAPDNRWSDTDLAQLGMLTASNFEVVDESAALISANSGISYSFNVALFPPAVRRGSLTSGYDTAVLADAPIAYYRLNQLPDAPVTDSSGHGYTGTMVGGVTPGQAGTIVGDADTAMQFDGASGHIALPVSLTPSGWTALTVEFWIKFTAFSPIHDVRILTDDQTSADKRGVDILVSHSTGDIVCALGNGTITTNGFTNSTYVLNTWYHIAFTWDGTSILAYRNGQYCNTVGTLTGSIGAPSGSFEIAGQSAISPNNFLNGVLQKLAVYQNKALTYLDIHQRYLIGKGLIGGTPAPARVPATTRRQS